MATTGVPTAAATCIGPLSLVMTTGAAPVKFREFKQVRPACHVPAALRDSLDLFPLGNGAGQHHAFARKPAHQFGKLLIPPQFRFPASGRIHGDQPCGRELRRDSQRKLDGTGSAAKMTGRVKVTVNRVGAGRWDDFVIEPAGAFPGIAQAETTRRAGRSGHDAAAEEAL